jgi:tRNA (cytidine/uridine-2'-O-)-methyltransferase
MRPDATCRAVASVPGNQLGRSVFWQDSNVLSIACDRGKGRFAGPFNARRLQLQGRVSAVLTLALFEPDIPQNTGTMLRMCACLGIGAALIEPAAFSISDPRFRRAAMDYIEHVRLTRHASWRAFLAWRVETPARLILLTTRANGTYTDFAYAAGDVLLVGRESAGVPEEVHAYADARVCVPMQPQMRSLNVAIAAAMVAGEALRQIRWADKDSAH